METKIIAFANQKGGVSKTTTTLTVGKEMAKLKYKVLLIDLDPQATLTQILGVQMSTEQKTVSDLMGIKFAPEPFENVVVNLEDLDLIGSNITLFRDEQILTSKINNNNILRNKLNKLRGTYDFILIDCPPSLGLFMTNGLMASDYIVIPTKPEVASVMSIDLFVDTLYTLAEAYGKEFDIAGFLLTMVEQRTKSFKQVCEYMQLKAQNLNTKVFPNVIRRSVACSDSIGGGMNVADTKSKVGNDYKEFVVDLINTITKEK